MIVLVLESLPWCSNMDHTSVTNSCTYCNFFTRGDSIGAGESALVFKHGPDFGDHSVVTRDLDVGPMSVLQFDVSYYRVQIWVYME